MTDFKLLDLFCGAGGAAMGYYHAGFKDITGIDNKPQKNYPFKFILGDALQYLKEYGHKYDVIHASPPCQAYSITKHINRKYNHPDLVGQTRQLLKETGKPYIIENVPGAPLEDCIMLCGSMFPGLRVYRHRYFECNPTITFPPYSCNHSNKILPMRGEYHKLNSHNIITCVGHNFQADAGRVAMGIDWMTRDEIAQAIPPAYTEWIGRKIMEILSKVRK